MRSLEFRIPISPNRSMYSNVRLAALSLARLGAPYSQARILVSVGDCASHEQVVRETPWSREFPIEWRIASHQSVETSPYSASGNDRYSENPRADVVVLCDADLCLVDQIDELLERLDTVEPRGGGMLAHYPPFSDRHPNSNDRMWNSLIEAAGLPPTKLDHGYSMVPDRVHGGCPVYYNYGFVAFNRTAFLRVAPIIGKYTEIARRVLERKPGETTAFQSQIGLSLALLAAEVEGLTLSHAYNCANDEQVFEHGLANVEDIKVIHYLRREEFDRESFVSEPGAHRAFLAAPLAARVSERLRRHVMNLPDPLLSPTE